MEKRNMEKFKNLKENNKRYEKSAIPFCMFPYCLLLSKPLYKLTIRDRQTGRQADRKKRTSLCSAQKRKKIPLKWVDGSASNRFSIQFFYEKKTQVKSIFIAQKHFKTYLVQFLVGGLSSARIVVRCEACASKLFGRTIW